MNNNQFIYILNYYKNNNNILFFLYKYFVYILIFALSFSFLKSQTPQDLIKLKSEYEGFQKKQNTNQSTGNAPIEADQSSLPKEAIIVPYKITSLQDSLNYEKSKYFGYNFFIKRDTVNFWENLPAPANYVLGPGDELVISLWGETQMRTKYTISRDGSIYDDKVGILNLMGKSLKDAQFYLKTQFSRVYSTLEGTNASTFIDITLDKLRTINVNFVGELEFPGIYPVHPFSTVITGLIQAGGVDTSGSLRSIQLKRDGKLVAELDLYDYLLKGNLSQNMQLRDQDIVIVPTRVYTVKLDSAIVRPAIYEGLKGETVKNLIDYAGGLRPEASTVIELERILPFGKRNSTTLNSENYYINYNQAQEVKIQNGDILTFHNIFKSPQKVEILGQVKRPGIYSFYEGMKLKELVELSGGFADSTFLKSVYSSRGELVRRNPKAKYESVIEVNILELMNNIGKENLALQNFDRFLVHENPNYLQQKPVQILGEVNIPGSYPLIEDNESLQRILDRAGGLTSKALENGISIYRDKKYYELTNNILIQEPVIDPNNDNFQKQIEQNQLSVEKKIELNSSVVRVAWQNKKIALMPGDSIIVKEKTMTVNISGEIYNPGLIEFRKGKSLNYYINSAGGITNFGNRNNIIVVYANGIVVPKKWYKSPVIEDGATIIINKKPYEEPFNMTQFATNWTSIISSVITTIILSRQLSSG